MEFGMLHLFENPIGKTEGQVIKEQMELMMAAESLGFDSTWPAEHHFSEYGFWRVRHCAQARCIENQVYFVHCATGGKVPKGPLPNGWTRSSILSPCDTPWPAPNGVVAEAETNVEMVLRGTVDLDLLQQNRETGVAPTYRDRRRRADCYRAWPSHLDQPVPAKRRAQA